jgi:SAM-dependent methyltransferase
MSEVSIAKRVLGVDIYDAYDINDAQRTAYSNLIGEVTDEQYEEDLVLAEIMRASGLVLSSPTDSADTMQHKFTVIESLEDIFNRTVIYNSNTLAHWPSYQRMMEEKGRRIGGAALMVGSFSPLSSRSFDALAEDVYGAESTVIVDLVSCRLQAKNGNFVAANGLNLPFGDSTFNYVHTNLLLHMLEDTSGKAGNYKDAVKKLFEELQRVLAPNGQLFMYERSVKLSTGGEVRRFVGWRTARFARFIRKVLTESGFACEAVDPAKDALLPAFLFDKTRDFNDHDHVINPYAVEVFARKSAQG